MDVDDDKDLLTKLPESEKISLSHDTHAAEEDKKTSK